jgi:sugar phosphate isomerase/epimerase
VRIGLLTDAFEHKTLEETLVWCAENGLDDVELGTGGYSPAPHLSLEALDSEAARRDLLATVADHGLRIGALNASGNVLHPDATIASRHDAVLRATVELAHALGVTRIVAMSGCPGGPGGGGWPVFAGGAWLPDMEGLWDWQWRERVAPYWSEFSGWAASVAPEVRICLELHPGTSIYNAESYHQLREAARDNVLVNLDPSHFWWQGMEPVTVIEQLPGAIGWSHGKDTTVHPDRVARSGVLDFLWPRSAEEMTWHFSAVGSGHDDDTWVALVRALLAAGHDETISIEHEDPNLSPEDGVRASLDGLRRAIAGTTVPA